MSPDPAVRPAPIRPPIADRRARAVSKTWTSMAGITGSLVRWYLRTDPHGPVIVVPPTGNGSLGDQAMDNSIQAQIRSLGFATVAGNWERSTTPGSLAMWRCRGRVPLVGWLSIARDLRRLRPAALVMLGADVMNGYYSDRWSARYWNVLTFCSNAGLPVAAVGFSWNQPGGCGRTATAAARACPADVVLVCRDEVSATRLGGVLGRPVPWGADLAFLIDPAPDEPSAQRAFDAFECMATRGQRKVVLNLNGGLLGPPSEQSALVEDVGRQIAALERSGVGIVVVPHTRSDVGWAEEVVRVARHCGSRSSDVVVPDSAAAAKAIVQRADGVVTGRMHLCIAALGSGTPVRAMDYQGKVEGLEQLFPGVDLRVDLPPPEFARSMTMNVHRVLDGGVRDRALIAAALPGVRAAAARMLGHVTALDRPITADMADPATAGHPA